MGNVRLSRLTGLFLCLLLAACCSIPGCLEQRQDVPTVPPNSSIGITHHMGVFGGDSFLVFGKAQNTGDIPIERVVLVVDFLDAGKRKVASRAIGSIGPVQVNGTWDFEASLDGPPAREVRYYEITTLYR